jgi:DNA replicative helicase MCM subunit Mcm2 (Cdc46/Mcm family)
MSAATAVVAAANPEDSSWGDYDDLQSQFGFEDSFLSRFDTVWAIRNNSMGEAGGEIADSIIDSLTKDAEDVTEFNQEWLQKYVYVARQHEPSVNKEVYKMCKSAWQDLIPDEENAESREFMALIRLSMAFARMEFGDQIAPRHAQQAIDLWKSSLETYAMDESGEIDMGLLRDGVSSEVQDRRKDVLELVKQIEEEKNRGATPKDFTENLEQYEQLDINDTLTTLMEQGILHRLPDEESGTFARV